VPNPDPLSGLYIKSRSGEVVKAVFPADHLGFQIGETACVHSGGWLYATPHCVRGAIGPKAKGKSFCGSCQKMYLEINRYQQRDYGSVYGAAMGRTDEYA
jgi:hypothetical protein